MHPFEARREAVSKGGTASGEDSPSYSQGMGECLVLSGSGVSNPTGAERKATVAAGHCGWGFPPATAVPPPSLGPWSTRRVPPPLAQSCLGHSRCCCQQLRASVNTQQAQSTEKTSKASQAETKAAVPSFPRLIKDSCPSLYSGANQRRVEPHVSVSPT